MTTLPKKLAGADWLMAPPVQAVFAALDKDGDSVRVVGGAVRNALIGEPVSDIDFATTAPPDLVTARAEAAGFKVVPTGIDHGTLTVVIGGHGYQVTTLRQDVVTDGRRAVVEFGRDWDADAARRDFTVNALSVDAAGDLHDPIGGYGDLREGRIRFIGDPDKRIAEDRLRILRFFRFHAAYGRGPADPAGLSAAIRGRDGLRALSAERIGQEMRRLVVARRAPEVVTLMEDTGVLQVIFGGIGYLCPFERLAAAEAAQGAPADPSLRLAALGVAIEEDAFRITERLRLANSERERMLAAAEAARRFRDLPDDRSARRLLYRLGATAFRDGLLLGGALAARPAADARTAELYRLPEVWPVPVFPLGGREAMAAGAQRGPALGRILKDIEEFWIAGDFSADAAALKARLQQMVASAQ
jgi:tRNA nucleotidyltransferase/poly(A) polymerase